VVPRNLGGPAFKFADGAVEGGVKASVKLRRGFVGEAFDKLLSFSKGLLGIAGEGLEASGNFFGAAAINNQLFFPEVLGLDEAETLSPISKMVGEPRSPIREFFSAACESQNLWEKELVVYRSRAEEISRRLEALAGNSQQTLAETQKFVECFANETAPKLHARLNASFDRAIGELKAGPPRFLAPLDSNRRGHATCRARGSLPTHREHRRGAFLLSTAGAAYPRNALNR